MQIIWDSQIAEKLRDAHTVLELETFMVKDKPITTYCVVPAEKILISDFANLDQHKALHSAFIEALKNNNNQVCQDLSKHLIGKFGGELDTFYEEILKRIR
jgi:superoxide dismutase